MAKTYTEEQAKLLCLGRGTDYRDVQKDCVQDILDGAKRDKGKDVFCVMPTGVGKSACFQIPGLVLEGITLVVCPLLALIDDQVNTLNRKGIPALSWTGDGLHGISLPEDPEVSSADRVLQNADTIKFLYTTPEMLLGRQAVFSSLPISLLVLDEAHCARSWGADFRPAYRFVSQFLRGMKRRGRRPVAAAFTATADGETAPEIIRILGLDMAASDVIWSSLSAPSPQAPAALPAVPPGTVRLFEDRTVKGAAMLDFIAAHSGQKGIVFCSTRDQVHRLARLLQTNEGTRDIEVFTYMADIRRHFRWKAAQIRESARQAEERAIRREALQRFRAASSAVMVATSAFGMGVNIPGVRYVVHDGFPLTTDDYTQQCGRAGRDGQGSLRMLFACPKDLGLVVTLVSRKDLLMYPAWYGADIRIRDRDELCSLVGQCIAASPDPCPEDLTANLAKFRARTFSEARCGLGKKEKVYLVLNCSADLRRKIAEGRLTYYASVVADGVYSLWYNGCREFTPRRLAWLLSGGQDGLTPDKGRREELEQCLDRLAADWLLPIEKATENGKTKYLFSDRAQSLQPGAFPLQKSAADEHRLVRFPISILTQMSCPPQKEKEPAEKAPRDAKKGRHRNSKDILILKFYLLRELNRVWRRSQMISRAQTYAHGRLTGLPLTSPRIIYSRTPHTQAGLGPVGLFHLPDFEPYRLKSPSAWLSKQRYLHSSVCEILDNLKANRRIGSYDLLTEDSLDRRDPRDGTGLLMDGQRVRGIIIKFGKYAGLTVNRKPKAKKKTKAAQKTDKPDDKVPTPA